MEDKTPAKAVDLDAFFGSHELRDEMANKIADATGNLLAYPVAYTILGTDPNRYEDYKDNEAYLVIALTAEVRTFLAEMRSDLKAYLDYGHTRVVND